MNKLIYDYDPDGAKRYIWLVVPFSATQYKSCRSFYTDITKYETEYVSDFMDGYQSCTVVLNELTSGRDEYELGVDLELIRRRIGDALDGIEQFIILAADVEAVIQMSSEMLD
nr:MAG TPA: hypothetical protein [Caudoviricetes sp.]